MDLGAFACAVPLGLLSGMSQVRVLLGAPEKAWQKPEPLDSGSFMDSVAIVCMHTIAQFQHGAFCFVVTDAAVYLESQLDPFMAYQTGYNLGRYSF